MDDSVFTKIIRGDIPCHKIYEDDKTFAFLDIHPDKPGHTLVVTKVQVDQYMDLSDDDYFALWAAVKKISKHLKQVLETDRVRLVIVGTDVPHVHVHLVPFNEADKSINPGRDDQAPDNEALAALAKKLAF